MSENPKPLPYGVESGLDILYQAHVGECAPTPETFYSGNPLTFVQETMQRLSRISSSPESDRTILSARTTEVGDMNRRIQALWEALPSSTPTTLYEAFRKSDIKNWTDLALITESDLPEFMSNNSVELLLQELGFLKPDETLDQRFERIQGEQIYPTHRYDPETGESAAKTPSFRTYAHSVPPEHVSIGFFTTHEMTLTSTKLSKGINVVVERGQAHAFQHKFRTNAALPKSVMYNFKGERVEPKNATMVKLGLASTPRHSDNCKDALMSIVTHPQE